VGTIETSKCYLIATDKFLGDALNALERKCVCRSSFHTYMLSPFVTEKVLLSPFPSIDTHTELHISFVRVSKYIRRFMSTNMGRLKKEEFKLKDSRIDEHPERERESSSSRT